MSYSFSFNIVDQDVPDEDKKRVEDYIETLSEESQQAAALALVAATEIYATGIVGSPDKKFRVVVSGHANPDHEPQAGWANDSLGITIAQVDAE